MLNKVTLIGRLGKDPEVRYLDSGVCVATFSLATTERGYTTSTGQQIPERTEWHDLVLWRGLAETAEKYLHKGDLLYVEGVIRKRSYEDQQGIKRTVTEIYVSEMKMLTPKPQGGKGLPPDVMAPPPATASQPKDAAPQGMVLGSGKHQVVLEPSDDYDKPLPF